MATLAQLILIVVGFVFLVTLLDVVWSREQIKKDLRRRSCAPIRVRWHPYPFGYWTCFGGHAFRVTFVDATGCIQTVRCASSRFSPQVRWVSDDLKYLDSKLSRYWRWFSLIVAIGLGWFALHHLVTGTLVWPGRFSGRSWQWQGWPVWLMSVAALCCGANLLVRAFFCRRTRVPELLLTFIARGAAVAGWILFWASFAVALWLDFRK